MRRGSLSYYQRFVLVAVVADLAASLVAYGSAFLVRIHVPMPFTLDTLPAARFFEVDHHVILLLASQVGILYFFGFYDMAFLGRGRVPAARVPVACAVQAAFIVSVYFFRGDPVFPRSVLLVYWLFDTALVAALREVMRRRALAESPRRTVLVGAATDVALLLEGLERRARAAEYGIRGWIATEDKLGDATVLLPCLGRLADVLEGRIALDADEVLILSDETWKERLLDLLNRPPNQDRSLSILPSRYEIAAGSVGALQMGDIRLNEVTRRPEDDLRFILKAGLDRAVAAVALLLAAPVVLVVALLITLTSPGPVIYRQVRVGRAQRPFTIRKFRTMTVDAERDGHARLATEGDARVTWLGRWLRATRLDELPQLWNVLDGTMSLVGPRPERPEFVARFLAEVPGYYERFRIKPGLTGLAQVYGEYHTTPAYKLKYDLAYIYQYSLWLDMKILFETVKVMLTRRGV